MTKTNPIGFNSPAARKTFTRGAFALPIGVSFTGQKIVHACKECGQQAADHLLGCKMDPMHHVL